MSRLTIIDTSCSCSEVQKGFEKAKQAFGRVPNLVKVLANSSVAVNAFVDYWSAMYQGRLEADIRSRIGLAIGQANTCQYCVSAHSAIAESVGLTKSEIEMARAGSAVDKRADAAVKFALAILENRGDLTDNELKAVREAGFSDGEIVEIILLVAMFSAGNYIGKVSQMDIDFPAVKSMASLSS